MSSVEFKEILNSIDALSPEQMRRLRDELDSKMASVAGDRPSPDDPLLGSMSDHCELMDQIVEEAMRNRERQPWRLNASE